jgi:hypothetical protein
LSIIAEMVQSGDRTRAERYVNRMSENAQKIAIALITDSKASETPIPDDLPADERYDAIANSYRHWALRRNRVPVG